VVYRFFAHAGAGELWRQHRDKIMQAIRECKALHAHNERGETLLHTVCNADTYKRMHSYFVPALPVFVNTNPVMHSVALYRNRVRGFGGELLALMVRTGADLHAPDAHGNVPLIMLGQWVWRNLLTVGTLQALMLGTATRGRRPIDWNATDAQGNTALHWAFNYQKSYTHLAFKIRRRGQPIQTLVHALGEDGAMQKKVLAQIDLLAPNSEGRTLLRLMASHCLAPRSMREHQSTFNWWSFPMWDDDTNEYTLLPERFPDCANAVYHLDAGTRIYHA
jgi:hypothetical protein